MLICGGFTNLIALPILTENHKWRLNLDFGMFGQQVIIAIFIIIIAAYYTLFNGGLVLLTLIILVICRFD